VHKFALSNCVTFSIYASPYTPKFGDYAFMYDFHEDRFNNAEQATPGKTSIAKQPIPEEVDIVITHGPPRGHHDKCRTGNARCDMLMRALERTKPQMHCFGHIHEGAGTSTLKWRDGKEILLVNAAVMGGEGDPTDKPTNMPIVVELKIPRTCEA
jgi:predicted phosphohydrolase